VSKWRKSDELAALCLEKCGSLQVSRPYVSSRCVSVVALSLCLTIKYDYYIAVRLSFFTLYRYENESVIFCKIVRLCMQLLIRLVCVIFPKSRPIPQTVLGGFNTLGHPLTLSPKQYIRFNLSSSLW
jgi:hypothetical protein